MSSDPYTLIGSKDFEDRGRELLIYRVLSEKAQALRDDGRVSEAFVLEEIAEDYAP